MVKQPMASFTVRLWSDPRYAFAAKRSVKWENDSWFLHHDNSPDHTSLVVRHFPTPREVTVIPHPNYSPNLASCDFLLLPKKRKKGRKAVVFTRLRRSNKNHKRLWTHSHFRTSRDRCNHGRHAGIAVYKPRTITWKKKVEIRSLGNTRLC